MLKTCLSSLCKGQFGICLERLVPLACSPDVQHRWLSSRSDDQDEPTPSTSDRNDLSQTSNYSNEPSAQFSPILRNMRSNLPDSLSDLIPPLEPRPARPDSIRTGMLAVKAGMVSEWDEHGVLTPYTVLWFDDNQVKCPF